MYLQDNQLSGEVPSELGSLSNLEWLWLQRNQLSGEIPPELGNLSNLTHLYLQDNQLSGVPPELGNLSNLERLNLSGNQLSGEIPPELGNLSNLTHLYLQDNQLSGEVPSELGSLSNLEWLWLQRNQLSGEIPPELGNLSNLTHLYLQDNQLSGVPPELGNLSNLERLNLSGNQLSGEIPPELGNLSNLTHLYLQDNQLSGEVPSELGSLSNLEWLWLQRNQLSGEIPPELGNLSNLTHLYLQDNQLSGVPPELGNLSRLERLNLSGNSSLSGPLPRSFIGLTSLRSLSLSGTGMCAPTDATFQAWLGGIAIRFGVVNCAELTDRDATLKGLTLSGIDFGTFDSTTTSYTAQVANSVSQTTVTPAAKDSGASYVIKLGGVEDADGEISLGVGSNVITVEVTAEDDSTTGTYTVTVTRAEPPSTDANLSALAMSGIEFGTFAAGTTSYTAQVANSVSQTTVTPTVNDSGAKPRHQDRQRDRCRRRDHPQRGQQYHHCRR